MRNTIVSRARDGAAILLSSHLLHLVEEICSRVIIMDRGRKIADGTSRSSRPARIWRRPGRVSSRSSCASRATTRRPASRDAPAMSMFRASLYIVVCTARNRLRVRLRRLREPRYLIGAIVGAAYLYFTFFARMRATRGEVRRRGTGAPPMLALAAVRGSAPGAVGLALMTMTALGWLLPFDSGLLDFSEAEIQFLFPAPVSRRALLIHRMIRSQIGLLFGGVIIGVAMPTFSGYARLRAGIAMCWFIVRIEPQRDELGHVIQWYGTNTDIDDLKRAEEKLRRDEQELRRITDAIPQTIIVLGPDGSVIYANRSALDYTGFTMEEVMATDFRARVFHPEDVERLRDERQKALSRGIPFENEQRARRNDGQYRWFLIRYNPLFDEQGSLLRWYATGTDIHDRKQTEERMRTRTRPFEMRSIIPRCSRRSSAIPHLFGACSLRWLGSPAPTLPSSFLARLVRARSSSPGRFTGLPSVRAGRSSA